MSDSREGSRETEEGIIISVPMDWHKTKEGTIIAYRIWARQREAANLANSVRQTDDRSHVLGSVILQCYGAKPDEGTGLQSKTTNAECTPKTWSETVRAEGRNMVRHDDEWWMNHKNTWGRLYYIKDPAGYTTPGVANITPLMSPQPARDATATSGIPGTPVAPTATNDVSSAETTDLRSFTALAPEGLLPATRKDAVSTDSPTKISPSDGHEQRTGFVRVSAQFPCQKSIGSYGSLSCPNEQKHKFVPDWTMGESDRDRRKASGTGRIPNMPARKDMPAICLDGDGQDTSSEHGQVQEYVDGKIAETQKDLVAPLGKVLHTAVKSTADYLKKPLKKGDCEQELQAAVDKAFTGKNMDQLVQANPNSVNTSDRKWIGSCKGPMARQHRCPLTSLVDHDNESGADRETNVRARSPLERLFFRSLFIYRGRVS